MYELSQLDQINYFRFYRLNEKQQEKVSQVVKQILVLCQNEGLTIRETGAVANRLLYQVGMQLEATLNEHPWQVTLCK